MKRTLVIHIGTGKTGTSAIQGFLAKNAGPLRELGVHSWGRFLEDAFTPAAFAWQRVDGGRIVQDLGHDTVAASSRRRSAGVSRACPKAPPRSGATSRSMTCPRLSRR